LANNSEIEETLVFTPQFGEDGLVTAVVTDATSGDVLMVAHMNQEAVRKTIESGEAWYYSRSRKKLWKKGESSGHVQRVIELRVDCDQDALWLKVEQTGEGACHTGALVLLPRDSVRQGWRGHAGVPQCRQDVRPAIGLWRRGRQVAPVTTISVSLRADRM